MTDDPSTDAVAGPSDAETREFARLFRGFLEWVHTADRHEQRNPVAALVREFLGETAGLGSVVSRSLAGFEHVNLQAAVNAWSAEPGRHVEVQGLHNPVHHDRPDLESLIAGELMMPLRLGSPTFVDLPNGPGSTLACLRLALLLISDERGRYVLLFNGPGEHMPGISVEVAGLPVAAAQEVLGELDDLRRRLNVYRGHVIAVGGNDMGGVSLAFAEIPQTRREDVVLPPEVLARIERHALEMARHRDALRARGQHLKRGVLLFGPPGTGKTHTTRYLVGEMTDYTRFLLSGNALHTIGSLAELARALQPALVVLEDVDLVAEDRDFGDGSSSVLFDLLDAMDGAAADADLLFLLTTNRADLLEPALAARPGRVDVAVEIGLPDADARRQLLDLYGRSVSLRLAEEDVAAVIERTDGVTASFVKEMLRRAVLESLIEEGGSGTDVTAQHIARALDDLLDSAQQVTRTLLGVGYDPQQPPAWQPPRAGRHGHARPGVVYGSGLDITFDDD